jgi:hypothetical protein
MGVCATAGAAASASKVTAQTERTIVLSMYGLLIKYGGMNCRDLRRRKLQSSYLRRVRRK